MHTNYFNESINKDTFHKQSIKKDSINELSQQNLTKQTWSTKAFRSRHKELTLGKHIRSIRLKWTKATVWIKAYRAQRHRRQALSTEVYRIEKEKTITLRCTQTDRYRMFWTKAWKHIKKHKNTDTEASNHWKEHKNKQKNCNILLHSSAALGIVFSNCYVKLLVELPTLQCHEQRN